MKPDKPQFVSGGDEFVNGSLLQLTLREIHTLVSNMRFWMAMTAIVAVLAVAGPFGTSEFLAFLPRLIYWATIAVATFFTGLAVSLPFGIALERIGMPRLAAYIGAGAVAGLPVALVVMAINHLVFRTGSGLIPPLEFLVQAIVISTAISVLNLLVNTRHANSQSTAPAGTNPFLRRIKQKIGTDIICIQAQDHYIEANTTNGSELILARLADAVEQLAQAPAVDGIQTHRSWWVARSHVEKLDWQNGRLYLVLSNGQQVPVSRSRTAEARRLFG